MVIILAGSLWNIRGEAFVQQGITEREREREREPLLCLIYPVRKDSIYPQVVIIYRSRMQLLNKE
jgi:hypothetical protein